MSDLRFWLWETALACAKVTGMLDHPPPAVVGLVPRAVRLQLNASQVELLANELLTRVEARAGSLREDHDRHGRLPTGAHDDAVELLEECQALLDALTGARAPSAGVGLVAVIASTPTADTLVRACA